MRHWLVAAVVAALPLAPIGAQAHAFLDHATPAVGSTLTAAPLEVSIWFTEEVEPAFSKIQVLDAAGNRVDKGNTQIDAKDGKLLHIALNTLKGGTYKVVWQVVSVDTHHTNGDFSFTVGQ